MVFGAEGRGVGVEKSMVVEESVVLCCYEFYGLFLLRLICSCIVYGGWLVFKGIVFWSVYLLGLLVFSGWGFGLLVIKEIR